MESSPEPEARSPFKINLENYYGPLDLLLHLVKETEVDITRVSLAQVADQYVGFLEAMKSLDVGMAGEFLILASQLLLIKSRAVVPTEETEEEEEEEDASLELIRRLLEYKIYKDRARELAELQRERSLRTGRPRVRIEDETEEEPPRDFEIWDLVVVFARLVKATHLDARIDILYQDVPVEVFIEKILTALRDRDSVSFRELVGDPNDRGKIVGTLLALLELMKDQQISAEQAEDGGEIRIRRS